MSEWISVKAKSPKENEMVLICGRTYNKEKGDWYYGIAIYRFEEYDDANGEGHFYARYWRPLPKFPKD